MGTIRGIKGQDRWKRHEPKLSEETLKDLHRYALQTLENKIYDEVTEWGEMVVPSVRRHSPIIINDQMWLNLPEPDIALEAVKNLTSGGVVEILERDEDRIRVKSAKSSDLPDIQFKILRLFEEPFYPRPQTPMDIKYSLNLWGFKSNVKEIRAALVEMKRKGLVEETKDWRGKKAWTKV